MSHSSLLLVQIKCKKSNRKVIGPERLKLGTRKEVTKMLKEDKRHACNSGKRRLTRTERRRSGVSFHGSLYIEYAWRGGKSTLSSPSARVLISPNSVAYCYLVLWSSFNYYYLYLIVNLIIITHCYIWIKIPGGFRCTICPILTSLSKVWSAYHFNY